MSVRNIIGAATTAALLLTSSFAAADDKSSPVPTETEAQTAALAPLAPATETIDADSVDAVKLYSGITLISAGGLAALGGGITYFALSASTPATGTDPYKSAKTGGIVAMVLGGAAIGAGIPLILTSDNGDQAATNDKNSAKPTVRVGAGNASAAWSF